MAFRQPEARRNAATLLRRVCMVGARGFAPLRRLSCRAAQASRPAAFASGDRPAILRDRRTAVSSIPSSRAACRTQPGLRPSGRPRAESFAATCRETSSPFAASASAFRAAISTHRATSSARSPPPKLPAVQEVGAKAAALAWELEGNGPGAVLDAYRLEALGRPLLVRAGYVAVTSRGFGLPSTEAPKGRSQACGLSDPTQGALGPRTGEAVAICPLGSQCCLPNPCRRHPRRRPW